MTEIIVSVAIIGVLAAVLVSRIDPSSRLKKTHDSERKASIKVIQSALEVYRSDQGKYPDAGSRYTVVTCASTKSLCDSTSGATYLRNVPVDPKTGLNYFYCTINGPNCSAPTGGYALYSCLENSAASDPDALSSSTLPTAPANGSLPWTNLGGCAVGASSVYYGVVSP